MNIEPIIKAAREVVATHGARQAAPGDGWGLDLWTAKRALLSLEGVPMPSEEGGALALATLVIAAFDAGYSEGIDDGMNK